MTISTPLGEDFLLINRMSATEAISELFSFEVELLHGEDEAGYEPTLVDVQAILGQAVSVKIKQKDQATRYFNGIVNRFSQGTRSGRFSFYYITIVPRIWILTQKTQSRIFQHKSVPDILHEVFKGFEVSYELQGSFKPRNYCVQYRESDFNFASRLMEEEGIYYYFEHSGTNHKMIIANTPQSHRDCPGKSEIPYFLNVSDEEDFLTSIKKWQTDYRLQSGKVTFWDNHFQLPKNKLDAQQPSRFNVGGNQNMEIYDFPGGYSRKYDDVDRTGGERSDVQNVFSDKQKMAEVTMQSLDAQYRTASGVSDCSSMTAGFRFKMLNHPNKELNVQYVITTLAHEIEQNPSYVSDEEVEEPYINNFSCLLHGAGAPPFRPPQTTVKPTIKGSQTATVVGPSGEEIFTDKYGRVKVQFHWDREGKNDADSSCWVRVGTLWAGKQWGVIHIPRIGQEVIVDFIEGNPDQPIVVGSVYNPETMPPYTLPENKTQSGVKSRSSKGGGPANFNEFRFEDKKGQEEVYLHAEKNWTIMVENDKNQIVGHDETLLVKHDRTKTVRHDETTTVVHDRTETVQNNETITIAVNRTEMVGSNETIAIGGNYTHDVAGNRSVSGGKNENSSIANNKSENVGNTYSLMATNEINESSTRINISAGAELVLSGPGGSIKIDASGVTITGVLVKIN